MQHYLNRGLRIYVIAAGAGAGIQQMLWDTPGASSYLTGCELPYDRAVTDRTLGFTPDSYVSRETAFDLAFSAYRKAYNSTGTPVGLGVTAAVSTNRARLGNTSAFVCCVTPSRITTGMFSRTYHTDTREQDGYDVDDLALDLLDLTIAGEGIDEQAGAYRHLMTRPRFRGAHRLDGPIGNRTLYPGAFNPPHAGHYHVADTLPGVVHQICTNPPHKGALSVQQMLERTTYFREQDEVMFTENDPLYIDKARKWPGRRIAIGADAVQRLLDPKWGVDPMYTLLEFEALGTVFDVFTRSGYTMPRIPSGFEHLFRFHDGAPGAWSSTAIREARAV